MNSYVLHTAADKHNNEQQMQVVIIQKETEKVLNKLIFMTKEDGDLLIYLCLRILKRYVIHLRVILSIKGMNSALGESNTVSSDMQSLVYNKCLIIYHNNNIYLMMGQALHWMPRLKVENIGDIGCIFISHCYILVL